MDLVSKLFYATDSGPMHDDAGYELCADAVDVLVDVGLVYDPGAAEGGEAAGSGEVNAPPAAVRGGCSLSMEGSAH